MDVRDARSVDELHRALVLHQSSGRGRSGAEPYEIFEHHHRAVREKAAQTAMLMLTDRRWRHAVDDLVRKIDNSGLVDEDELDLLAETFVRAGDSVYWQIPEQWFTGGLTVQIGMLPAVPLRDVRTDTRQPATVARRVRPPLRRWAAGRLMRRDPSVWVALHGRAQELSARDGAAVMCGLLEAVDAAPGKVQQVIVQLGLSWPQGQVRLLALGRMVTAGDGVGAYEHASTDADAGVRAWAAKQRAAAAAEPTTLF